MDARYTDAVWRNNAMAVHKCMKCGAPLCGDEIALHKKLFSRESVKFFCLDCMAEYCSTSREKLENWIAYFHRTGVCSLFAKTEDARTP